MAHLSDGVLRRMYDEPHAVTEVARGHFNQCDHCQQRFAGIAATARSAQAALSAPAVTVDAAAAFRSVSPQLERPRVAWLPRFAGSRRFRAAGVAALLAASLAVVAFISPLADVMTGIFSPTHVSTVPITTTSFQGMPDLSNWGTVKVVSQPELQQVASAQVAAGSDLPALDRAKAPAGLPAPQYGRVGQLSGTFTFDAAKAQAAAARDGKKSPALPANLNGSILQLTAGPAEFEVYGTIDPQQVKNGQVPQLVIAAAHKPVLSSNGATVKQIEDAVLAQPGVSPEMAAQVRAMGDPTTTLPIPIPADKASSHSVTLKDGTAATYIGDNTGIAAGLIWIKGNYVYGVAGSLHEADLVAVANSLLS